MWNTISSRRASDSFVKKNGRWPLTGLLLVDGSARYKKNGHGKLLSLSIPHRLWSIGHTIWLYRYQAWPEIQCGTFSSRESNCFGTKRKIALARQAFFSLAARMGCKMVADNLSSSIDSMSCSHSSYGSTGTTARDPMLNISSPECMSNIFPQVCTSSVSCKIIADSLVHLLNTHCFYHGRIALQVPWLEIVC
jgi:hypothetical protein